MIAYPVAALAEGWPLVAVAVISYAIGAALAIAITLAALAKLAEAVGP